MNNKKSALPVQYLTEFQFSINHGRSPAARALCTYTIYAIRNSNLSARANVYGLDILVAKALDLVVSLLLVELDLRRYHDLS